jgi:hypothetical protein
MANATVPPDGWQDIELSTGSGLAQYRVVDGLVFVKIDSSQSIAAGATVTIAANGAIPAEYCPATRALVAVFQANSFGWLQITPAGALQVHCSSGAFSVAIALVSYPIG